MKAKLMLCLCLLLAATTMFAQNLTVTGVVTEKATGYPAIGVSVLVKGTTNGTITSMDGDYTLSNVPKNATLVFSYVGMTTQEVPVNGQTVVNVLMNEEVAVQFVITGISLCTALFGSTFVLEMISFQEENYSMVSYWIMTALIGVVIYIILSVIRRLIEKRQQGM